MGFLLSVLTSILYTIYVFPKKISSLTPVRYSFFQEIGFLLAASCAFGIQKIAAGSCSEPILSPYHLISFGAGVLWFAGSTFFLAAVDRIGLTRSNQWKNLQGPVSAAIALTILGEAAQTNIIFIILASISILVSALFLTVSSKDSGQPAKRGVWLALFAALFSGIFAATQKYIVSRGFIFSQQFFVSLGALTAAIIYLLISEKSLAFVKITSLKEGLLGIAGGILYFSASLSATFSYRYLPASIAFTIVQLNALWTVLSGIFIFKEMSFRQHWKRIALGLIFAVIGVILLLFGQR